MRVRFVSALVATLVACKDNPSRIDQTSGTTGSSDPWRQTTQNRDKDKAELSGMDIPGVLDKIRDGIDTPGPYEAPKQSKTFDADQPHWGVMRLHGGVIEREAFSLTGGGRGTELRHLIDRLRALAKNDKLQGLLVRIDDLEISLADYAELRDAMHELRAAKKQLWCHAESATNATYLVLAACDKIALAPLGEIAITGPAARPIHVKGLLDKLSIQADFIHVGAYKGAAEPLTRDAPSKEMQETLNAILDRRYQTMVDDIAKARGLAPDAVKNLIDTALFTADQAKAAKLVDEVVAWETLRDATKGAWTKLEIEPDQKDRLGAMIKLMRFLGAMPPERPTGPHVAVVYAIGNIVDGDGDGVLGARDQIAAHTLVSALRAIAADDTVKAVVLRIDSGGGSAQASELIWGMIEQLKATKPVIVSMSDVAASGGYYIASGATKIFAEPDTLTGSIGVVGGHIAPDAALAKLGVTTFPMGRGKHATMMASMKPWTPDEKALVQAQMEQVYGTFVARVAAGRKKTPADIQPIAQGRVWTGAKALELGLVDQLGGLDAAIAEAKKLAKLDATSELEVYPPTVTLRDVLSSFGQVSAPLGVLASSLGPEMERAGFTPALGATALRAFDPDIANAAERVLALVMSFRTTTIQTITFLPELR